MVAAYYQIIYKFLETNVDPHKVCAIFEICDHIKQDNYIPRTAGQDDLELLEFKNISRIALSSGSFPLKSLDVSPADASRLKVGDQAALDLAVKILNEQLADAVKEAGITVNVEEGDVVIDARFPDRNIDTGHSCSFTLQALNPHSKGVIKKSSKLTGGFSGSSSHIQVFAEALIDARLDLSLDLRARTGVKVFGHCKHLARKTLGIDLDTSGKVKLGAKLGAKNIKFDVKDGKFRMIFNVDFELYGSVEKWLVDDLNLSKCSIKLFGKWKILSYCSLAGRLMKKEIQKYVNKWTKLEVPKLINRLEDHIKVKNGQQVVLDIKLP